MEHVLRDAWCIPRRMPRIVTYHASRITYLRYCGTRPPAPGPANPAGGGPGGVGGAARAASTSAGVSDDARQRCDRPAQVGVRQKRVHHRLPVGAEQHQRLAVQRAGLQQAPGQRDFRQRADAAAHGHEAIGAVEHDRQAVEQVGALISSVSHGLGGSGSNTAHVTPMTRPPASRAPRLTAAMLPP